MKKLTLLLALTTAIQLTAQESKSGKGNTFMNPERWLYQKDKVEFVTEQGQTVMKLIKGSGPVVLKDVVFRDGTIEYDVNPVSTEFANSIYFHRKDEKEQEIVYLRTGRIGNKYANEGIQYCPYFDGINMWDMYPQYQAPAMAKPGEWNHIKLVISGKHMLVYVNGKQVLDIPKLEGRQQEGSIAFEGASLISHIVIKHGETEGLSPAEGADLTSHESNYIRNWACTQPSDLPAGTEPTAVMNYPLNEFFTGKIEAERAGLINLTRLFGANETRRMVWLKASIMCSAPAKTLLHLGFSDEVWLYLNNQLTYVDKNLFQENMKKYPSGRISVQNGSVSLNLRQGNNDILIGVANNFYGWGLIARLESTEGITDIKAFEPPNIITIENIGQYLGVYGSKELDFKITINQMNGILMAQATNQDPVPLSYSGNHVFTAPRLGAELIFKLTESKLIIKQNNNEMEFVKESGLTK